MHHASSTFNLLRRTVGAVSICLAAVASASASTVDYHGDHDVPFPFPAPSPLNDDFIIAGTFVPGFDVATYGFVFGDDVGNLYGLPHYSAAVNSGTFRPIGAGTISDTDGLFNGTGTTTGIDDLPIYLFLFDATNPDQSFNLALVTNPAWGVQAGGNITIDAATATIFQYGGISNGVIQLQAAPIPEPAMGAVIAGLMFVFGVCRRR